jgi:predicted DCC family thiol-disulfide oxidoreductase YuxK
MQPIVFFDGYCNLCNASVNWIMNRDKKEVFKFASLQGETALKLIANQSQNLDSVVLFQNGKIHTHYKAVGLICKQLPFPYNLGLVFYLLPDYLYNWIAKNRYQWFGKKETCRLPTEAEKSKFLP